MLLVLVLFGGVVGLVALPTLAAVLIYAGIESIRPAQIASIMRTAPGSRIALTATFLATLFLPIQAAVGIGVALSLLLQLRTGAMDLAVVELVPQPDGALREQPPPTKLPSERVTALDVYGSLLYAGARTLQVRLPDPAGSISPAVVLRLRGRTSLGATFFVVMADYASGRRGRRPPSSAHALHRIRPARSHLGPICHRKRDRPSAREDERPGQKCAPRGT